MTKLSLASEKAYGCCRDKDIVAVQGFRDEPTQSAMNASSLSVLQSVMVAGEKIVLVLTILSAPQAVPAYKLVYFNVLTNATVTITYPVKTELTHTALRFLNVFQNHIHMSN